MRNSIIVGIVFLVIAVVAIEADLLNCNEKKFISLPDFNADPKADVSVQESGEDQLWHSVLKNIGCQIKKGARKVKEQAKRLGSDLKAHVKVLEGRAREMGTDLKTRFHAFTDKLSKDSREKRLSYEVLSDVEIINPVAVSVQQECGNGFVLDHLGNCAKLRK